MQQAHLSLQLLENPSASLCLLESLLLSAPLKELHSAFLPCGLPSLRKRRNSFRERWVRHPSSATICVLPPFMALPAGEWAQVGAVTHLPPQALHPSHQLAGHQSHSPWHPSLCRPGTHVPPRAIQGPASPPHAFQGPCVPSPCLLGTLRPLPVPSRDTASPPCAVQGPVSFPEPSRGPCPSLCHLHAKPTPKKTVPGKPLGCKRPGPPSLLALLRGTGC